MPRLKRFVLKPKPYRHSITHNTHISILSNLAKHYQTIDNNYIYFYSNHIDNVSQKIYNYNVR